MVTRTYSPSHPYCAQDNGETSPNPHPCISMFLVASTDERRRPILRHAPPSAASIRSASPRRDGHGSLTYGRTVRYRPVRIADAGNNCSGRRRKRRFYRSGGRVPHSRQAQQATSRLGHSKSGANDASIKMCQSCSRQCVEFLC